MLFKVRLTPYKKWNDDKETACCKRILIAAQLFFNISVSDFDANKSAGYRRVLVVTELIASKTAVYQDNCLTSVTFSNTHVYDNPSYLI